MPDQREDESMNIKDSDFLLLQEQFKNHEEHEQQWRKEQDERWSRHESLLDEMMLAQKQNTEALGQLINETKGIVQLYKDFISTARIGKGLQNFMLYVVKWGAIGTFVITIIHFITEHFSKN